MDPRRRLTDGAAGAAPLERAALKPLSTTALPFAPERVAASPWNGALVAAAGASRCTVLALRPSGKVAGTTALELALEALGPGVRICDLFWAPGHEALLGVVTTAFVKLYDVTADTICPVLALLPPAGLAVCSATVAFDAGERAAVVAMTSDGALWTHPLGAPGAAGADGPASFSKALPLPAGARAPGARGAGRRVAFSQRSRVLTPPPPPPLPTAAPTRVPTVHSLTPCPLASPALSGAFHHPFAFLRR